MPAVIYLLVPLLGVLAFIWLLWLMSAVPAPPIVPMLVLFIAYGGWALVLLTEMFWRWSGAASIGVGLLVLAAPVVMLVQAWVLHKKRAVSAYHRAAELLSWSCIPFLVGVFVYSRVVSSGG